MYKSLETRVVILAVVDLEASMDLEAVRYLGCFRARTYLVILYDGALEVGGDGEDKGDTTEEISDVFGTKVAPANIYI
jgi:hypothetical protein